MKKALYGLLAVSMTSGMTAAGTAKRRPPPPTTPPVYTPGPAAEPTTGIRVPIGKCVNMGNMLDAPNEGEWGRAIADGDFAIIKAAGFHTVRIPVRWSSHAGGTAPYTIDPTFMARVKHVVGLAEAQGLGVILNVHHYQELMDTPAAHSQRFAELWKQIASEFRTSGSKVWFELLNEPINQVTHANLLSILNPALANVRATNPTRPVIIGGQWASSLPSLETLPMPNDPYVVPTFHYYDPFEFTHQGAHFVTNPPPTGRTWGSADYTQLDANVQKVKDYIARTGRVPFIGEYGAYDNIPLAERQKYTAAVTGAMAQAGIQSCAWSYVNTFRLREDAGTWIPGMVEAIKTTTNQ